MRLDKHTPTTAIATMLLSAAIAAPVATARPDIPYKRSVPVPQATVSEPAPVVVQTSAARGFDWGDAGIGAAGALGLGALAFGGVSLMSGARRQRQSAV